MNTENYTDHYRSFLKLILSPPRLQHSLGVMKVMGELAEIYQLDPIKAMTAGLLHDAAKDLPPEQLQVLAKEAGIKLHYPCEQHPIYLHGPVGAYLVFKELDITDRLILDAISTHSYSGNGENFSTPFSCCLRFADILAPSKTWKGMKKFKSVVYAGQMEEAALLHSGWLIEYLQELRIPIHPRVMKNFQFLSAKLGVSKDFFERW